MEVKPEPKPPRPQSGAKLGDRLYQESIKRQRKQQAQLIALNMLEQQMRDKSKVTGKSHQIVKDKLEKDLERIMFYIDFDNSGQFSIR